MRAHVGYLGERGMFRALHFETGQFEKRRVFLDDEYQGLQRRFFRFRKGAPCYAESIVRSGADSRVLKKPCQLSQIMTFHDSRHCNGPVGAHRRGAQTMLAPSACARPKEPPGDVAT